MILAAKLPRPAALAWMILLPYMFLPEKYGIDLPALPPLDKYTVMTGSIILAFWLISPPQPLRRTVRQRPSERAAQEVNPENKNRWLGKAMWLCVIVMTGGAFMTLRQNTAPLIFGDVVIQGTTLRDMLPFLLYSTIVLTPVFAARKYLTTPEARLTVMKACVTAGLIYSVLMLIEIRLSPQLHNWVYGFHQHSFIQHVRDGFRPKVFLPHGLEVGFFTFTTLLAALALWKETSQTRWLMAVAWLAILLVLSRNLGALMIAMIAVTLLYFNVGQWIRITVVAICVMFLSFPTLRVSPMSPVTPILNLAESISAERAASFAFRLHHEDKLLEKAMEKPLFGWGGYGRNRVFDETGRDLSVTDGYWILQVGMWGWVGYLSFFLLLCLPPIVAALGSRRQAASPLVSCMLLVIAGNAIYIIPNGYVSPVTWLMCGMVLAYAMRDAPQAAPKKTKIVRQTRALSRFPAKSRETGRLAPNPSPK